jgi:hypothetical protein
MSVTVLWLGNSDDAGHATGGSIPIAKQVMEAALHEPVEVVARVIWPTDNLPALISVWMERYQPDVVMFKLDAYWYLHQSLPHRVEQVMGRFGGGRVRRLGERAVRKRWVRKSPPYRAFRALATRSIGTATLCEKEYVADITEGCIRAVVSHEQVGMTVWGQFGAVANSPRGYQAWMYRRMSPLCRQLHVSFIAWDPATPPPPARGFHGDDPLHRNDVGHLWVGAREATTLLLALGAARTGESTPPFDFEANEISTATALPS